MLKPTEQFYLNLEEPNQSCFMAMREIILSLDDQVTEEWKYRMPFFYYKGKMFCYVWTDKKTKEPYLGVVRGNLLDHPALEAGDRTRIKILRINPNEDIPIELIAEILEQAMSLYK